MHATHAKQAIQVREVFRGKTFNSRAELREGSIYRLAVFGVRADQNIQILGRTWLRVHRNRIASNH